MIPAVANAKPSEKKVEKKLLKYRVFVLVGLWQMAITTGTTIGCAINHHSAELPINPSGWIILHTGLAFEIITGLSLLLTSIVRKRTTQELVILTWSLLSFVPMVGIMVFWCLGENLNLYQLFHTWSQLIPSFIVAKLIEMTVVCVYWFEQTSEENAQRHCSSTTA